LTSAIAGIAGRLGNISGELDPGTGKEGDEGIAAPEVGLAENADRDDDDAEYRCKQSATTCWGITALGVFTDMDDDDDENRWRRSATTHSSKFLRRTLSSSWRC
jgi:hypothetical protein